MGIHSKVLVLVAVLTVFSGCNSKLSDNGGQNQTGSSAPPSAPSSAPSHTNDSSLYYLTSLSIPVGTWLSPPYAPGSSEEESDLAAVLSLQSSRTQADCARAKTEVDITLDSLFGPAYGPLTGQEVSDLSPFIDKVMNDADYAAGREKTYWKRPRPYLVDSSVRPCLKLESSYSYPSGHSTISHTVADVLDLIFPSRKTQIDARADQIAEDRVIGGVHYPSDIAAGKLMSDRVFQAIQESDDFQQDLKTAETALPAL